jgi:hypothetical protein
MGMMKFFAEKGKRELYCVLESEKVYASNKEGGKIPDVQKSE